MKTEIIKILEEHGIFGITEETILENIVFALQEQYNSGYADGEMEGNIEGEEIGRELGYVDGYDDGYEQGLMDGAGN